MDTTDIEILSLPMDEWQAYRKIRLEALSDSPQAFGSTFTDHQAKPASFWQNRLEEAAKGERVWLLFARAGVEIVGMIGAYREDPDDPLLSNRLATIMSVYVTPAARGKGISKRLMQAIMDLLKQEGFPKAQLGVMAEQAAALHLYLGFGFSIVQTENNPMGDGLVHQEYMMERML